MSVLVLDKWMERRLIAQRRARGVDRHDEVWNGVYVMSPLPDLDHQELIAGITWAFQQVIVVPSLGTIYPGANVSDRVEGWKKNYRAPDVVVVLSDSAARKHGKFLTGPLDFVVEVVSRGDRSRKKFPFYSRIGVRELLLVERKPWRLCLYRHDGELLKLVGEQEVGGAALISEIIPFHLELLPGEHRPALRLTHAADGRIWLV